MNGRVLFRIRCEQARPDTASPPDVRRGLRPAGICSTTFWAMPLARPPALGGPTEKGAEPAPGAQPGI